MERSLSRLVGSAALVLLTVSAMAAVPAHALGGYTLTPEPVWATISATAQGNYPGGNEIFNIFIADSQAQGNTLIENMTLVSPFQTNFGIGLPVTFEPGDANLFTIAIQIPSDFNKPTFTANLTIDVQVFNGTTTLPLKLTGSAIVYVLGLPGATSTQTTSQTTSTSSTPSAGLSTTSVAVAVAIPSIIAVVLLGLLVQARGASKRTGA